MARLCTTLLLVALVTGHARAQTQAHTASPSTSPNDPALVDSCTPENPVVGPQESTRLRLWTAASADSSQYTWTVTAGRVKGHGVQVLWDLSGIPPGYATATVRYPGPIGFKSCSLKVIVKESAGERGAARDQGHDLLVKNTPEAPGYGLYSYVLLSAVPDDNAQPRCLQLLNAVLKQAPAIEDLGHYYDRKQLNLTYIPVTSAPQSPPSAQWLLNNYDYAHARFLLHALPGDLTRGPYLVSSLQPLSKSTSGPYIVQDLSSVPPHLVSLWTSEFLNQAAQEHFWEQSTSRILALRLRTAIGIMAEGLPDVRKSLNEWISLSK